MLDSLFRGEKYTTDELNARLKFFIGIILGLTLFGIVFVVLYSLIFVTQPMNGMSPVDNKFFELIIPIATFLTGTLSGIMLAGDDKDLKAKAIDAASGNNGGPTKPSSPSGSGFSASFSSDKGFSASGSVGGASMSFNKPASTPAAAGASFTPAPSTGSGFVSKPVVSKPSVAKPIDDDDMPPRD